MVSDTRLNLFSFLDSFAGGEVPPTLRNAKRRFSPVLVSLANLRFLTCLFTYYCHCHLDVYNSGESKRKKELVSLNTWWLL